MKQKSFVMQLASAARKQSSPALMGLGQNNRQPSGVQSVHQEQNLTSMQCSKCTLGNLSQGPGMRELVHADNGSGHGLSIFGTR